MYVELMAWDYFKKLPKNVKNELYIEPVTGKQIASDYLKYGKFDLVLLPGGDAEDSSSYLGSRGRKCLLEFMKGGCYVGSCAGAYLALTPNNDPEVGELIRRGVLDGHTRGWHYGMLNDYTSYDLKNWARGSGMVKLRMTKVGSKILKGKKEFSVYYANGPIMKKVNRMDIDDESESCVIAHFVTEKANSTSSVGKMKNTPAIIHGKFGKGSVLVLSPHLEYDPVTEAGKAFLDLLVWCVESNELSNAYGM